MAAVASGNGTRAASTLTLANPSCIDPPSPHFVHSPKEQDHVASL